LIIAKLSTVIVVGQNIFQVWTVKHT